MQAAQVGPGAQKAPAKKVHTVTDGDVQDRLLREVVRLMEAEHREHKWSWSWLSEQSELTASGYYAWRKGKTKGVFLRRLNSVLKPLGYRLKIERLK